mmetsp:Transcript_35611/g.70411  ORF Transcript_35611/g.70411 Transcript_35611/m.70411 type:complete len:98 (+) Transcript_35611:1340-1633(+)
MLVQVLATGCERLRGVWAFSDLPPTSHGCAFTLLNGEGCRCAGDGKRDAVTDAELDILDALRLPSFPPLFSGVTARRLAREPLALVIAWGTTKLSDF